MESDAQKAARAFMVETYGEKWGSRFDRVDQHGRMTPRNAEPLVTIWRIIRRMLDDGHRYDAESMWVILENMLDELEGKAP